jgi:hypothetical protein
MKYSLRSLMILVTVGPAVLPGTYFLIPRAHWDFGGTVWYGWDEDQRSLLFIFAVAAAVVGIVALARTSSYGK